MVFLKRFMPQLEISGFHLKMTTLIGTSCVLGPTQETYIHLDVIK